MNYDVYNFKDFDVEIDGMTITAITEDGLSWEKAEANGEAKIGALGDVIWQEIRTFIILLLRCLLIVRSCRRLLSCLGQLHLSP